MVQVEEMDIAQKFEAKLKTRLKPLNEITERGDSPIQQFYEGSTVFVTGGSGFLGKQLIEKLFRATKVSKVFVLLRSKKGKGIDQRLNQMLQDPVYELLREKQPDFAARIVPVEGDVAELRLGMTDKDWNMVAEQTDIIFHLAATTRFDECLRVSTMINVRGAREALLLGKDCKKLKSYVHVSTAYSNACDTRINNGVLEEFYKPPVDPDTLIKLAETLDEDRLNNITPSFIKDWPNTYSFAKAVAEDLVSKYSNDLPICVVRPAIVICAEREPNPGWVDISNIFGASGLVIGPGLGLMHVIFSDENFNLALVPVDQVNNAIIAAAFKTARQRTAGAHDTTIYTVTSTQRNPVNMGMLRNYMESLRYTYVCPKSVFYNFAWRTSNPTLLWIYTWLLHMIPAYLIDGVCLILGKERRFVKLYTKMYKMTLALSYFTVHGWNFIDDNTKALYDSLSTADKEIFDFDITKIDWRQYFITWCLGLRKYIIKDGLRGSAYGVKKQLVFKVIAYIMALIYFYCLFKVIYFAFSLVMLFLSFFSRYSF